MTALIAGRVAVTVAAGARQMDVTLPEGLPVAEVLGRLTTLAGVAADGRAALVTLDGRPLDPETGLRAQGVRDGAVISVEPAPPLPVRHDDPAVEVTSAVSLTGPFAAGDVRALIAAAGIGGLAVAGLRAVSVAGPMLWPGVVGSCAFAYAAVPAWAGRRALDAPGDTARIRRSVRAAYLLLAVVLIAATAHAPYAGLAAGAAVLLRARHHRDVASAAAVGGAGWLAVTTAVAATPEPTSVLAAFGAAALIGIACALTRPDSEGWWWTADVVERLALVALPVTAVLSTGMATVAWP